MINEREEFVAKSAVGAVEQEKNGIRREAEEEFVDRNEGRSAESKEELFAVENKVKEREVGITKEEGVVKEDLERSEFTVIEAEEFERTIGVKDETNIARHAMHY